MPEHIQPLIRLAEQFAKLPGVGRKSALRMAFSMLELSDESAKEFAAAIITAKESIHECPVCGNLTDTERCYVCNDPHRDGSFICVVEDTKAVISFEKVRDYRGRYHVLHGVISPLAGITPEKIRIAELVARVKDGGVREVIIATNPTPDGEVTASYISKILKPLGVRVSRLAYGVPVGSDLEYADEITLGRAIEGRRDFE